MEDQRMNQNTPKPPSERTRRSVLRILKHRWMDAQYARRAVPPPMAARLASRIAASEYRHSGEIRIIIEGGLPRSYLWRHASAKVRAQALFAKHGLWDTEHRNGVLIYLLLADHAIEIVADRGLNDKVDDGAWAAMVARLSASLKTNDFETGLTQALEEISALLVEHFPLVSGSVNENELPNFLLFL